MGMILSASSNLVQKRTCENVNSTLGNFTAQVDEINSNLDESLLSSYSIVSLSLGIKAKHWHKTTVLNLAAAIPSFEHIKN